MAFRKDSQGNWAPATTTYTLGEAFAAGVWNMGTGGGRFAPVMRPALSLEETLVGLKDAGCSHVEFHDTEAEPEDAVDIKKAVDNAGMKVAMCTANLFKRGPEFAIGNLGAPVAATRAEAIRRTKNYITTGIEVFQSEIYVYWNSSNGFGGPLMVNYADCYRQTAESLSEIVQWMLDTYGPEKALPIAIEPKPNEPANWAVPADAGETLAIIGMMPAELQPFVGTNLEVCHSTMAGKRYAAELGLVAAAKKAFYVHLNSGSGLKFDEDLAFGDNDFGMAVETVYTMQEIGYNAVVGIDCQPLNTDTADQQNASVARSVRNFNRALEICNTRINADELNALRAIGDRAGLSDLFARAVSGLS
ncbi:TIM barrel protein [Armatimonas rosea]|uniref:Xylose isomerase n=1 Tax=Armatimonas rosea TaxID=685828 RepID=A0A7W9W4U4_ARMRO|nr:TIM barrel protein [Armatimonas rosea]MBB6048918.1 xylose isomerase [Armatimonas rosea]